jgi:hypothetical protein
MLDNQDLAEFQHAVLVRLDIDKWAVALQFSTSASVMLQCAFECEQGDSIAVGHGEEVDSSPLLFPFLDQQVSEATIDADWVLTLHFEDGKKLKIIPERNGLESYVVTTRHGICPILIW